MPQGNAFRLPYRYLAARAGIWGRSAVQNPVGRSKRRPTFRAMKGEMAMLGSTGRLLGVWETIPAFSDTFGAPIAQRVWF